MPNRLKDSTSPYLLQHAHNPVDWFPWGKEALEKSRQEDKPIFLSIGYAACHWCHVMEHECFENAKIAELMNTHFINIKVDREERPDLDELYMLATQLMTGQGGWPMSVWLTPNLEPFYAGTYFPPTDGMGRPGFPRLQLALNDAWQNRRSELEAQAKKVVEAIRQHADETESKESTTSTLKNPNEWLRLATEQFADRFDEINGGLGGAPKFPPHQALQLWLAQLNESESTHLSAAEQSILAHKVLQTLDGMANGGIYDHVGGAFARYSTDERWLVPHFEKMLYDSAQLAPIYARSSLLFDNPDYARIARETLDFFIEEMMSPAGAFYSSLDADSEGAEGKYYVWNLADIQAALGDNAPLIIEHFGISREGNWHESPIPGGNVLAVAKTVAQIAQERGVPPAELRTQIDGLLDQMRQYRTNRPRPNLDDKVLTAWNGLMLSALAICGQVLNETVYLNAARRLAGFLLTQHMEDGKQLMRVSRSGGKAHTDAFLDDHAFLLNGLLDLLDAMPPGPVQNDLRQQAQQLADTLIRDFEDKQHGGFFFTGPRHEQLFARMKNAADNATPSANGVAIRALLRLSRVTGDSSYRDTAMRAIGAFEKNIARRPEYFPTILLGLLEDSAGPAESVPETGKSESPESVLELMVVEPVSPVVPGEEFELELQLKIDAGYHVQPHDSPDASAIKTVARVRSLDGQAAISQQWKYPKPELVYNGTGYVETVSFVARCRLPEGTPSGLLACRAIVHAQACSAQACLAPEQVTGDFSLIVEADRVGSG